MAKLSIPLKAQLRTLFELSRCAKRHHEEKRTPKSGFHRWGLLGLCMLGLCQGNQDALFAGVASVISGAEQAMTQTEMAEIPQGYFTPPFLSDTLNTSLMVPAFRIDRHPVSQKQFAAFTDRHPEWRRNSRYNLFLDANYLRNWSNDSTPSPSNAKVPVTYVSWHAAKAYCADLGKRLPTTVEWERIAATRAPGVDSLAMVQAILDWYGKPSGLGIDTLGSGTSHAYGVHDLHALIWEWTSDFRSWGYAKFGTGQSEDSARFCGAGGNRKNSNDFIVYMRYGFRSSLESRFAVAALGFRCAADVDELKTMSKP